MRRSAGLFLILALNILGPLRFVKFDYVVVDLAETIYHVRELGLGRIPYRDIFSHHFLGYLLPLYLIDSFAPLTPTLTRIVSAAYNAANCALVYGLCCVLGARKFAMLGALACATIGWLPGWQGDIFNNPSYFMPLMYAYLIFLFAWQQSGKKYPSLCAGGLLGLMLCFDQRLIVYAALALIAASYAGRDGFAKNMARFGIGAAIFPAAALFYLIRHGALDDFFQQTVVFPLFYRNKALDEAAISSVFDLLAGGIRSEPEICVLVAASLICARLSNCSSGVRMTFYLGILLSAVYVVMGGRQSPHYLLVFSPFLLSLTALLPFFAGKLSLRLQTIAALAVVLLSLFKLSQPFYYFMRTGSYFLQPDNMIVPELAKAIQRYSSPDSNILVWGYGPQIYLLSQRFSRFRDMGLISVAGANFLSPREEDQGIVPQMQDEFRKYLSASPPGLIVFYQKNSLGCASCFGVSPRQENMDFHKLKHLAYLRDFIDSRYSLVLKLESSLDRGEVYSLNPHS